MTHAVSAASKGDAVKPLHNASTADSYADLPFLPAGGVASAKGFKACGIHAGFRADPKRLDFALVAADQPAACAAVFTTNVFCSAPVTVSKEHLDGAGYGIARAVAINSGIANAATGDKGLQTARQSASSPMPSVARCKKFWWRPRALSVSICRWSRSKAARLWPHRRCLLREAPMRLAPS